MLWDEIGYPRNKKYIFNQYFLILNNTEEKDLEFNYALEDNTIFENCYAPDYTDDPITILRHCSDKTEFYIANVNEARYVIKEEYEEALTELTDIIKKHYPNFEGYEFTKIDHYDIPYSTQRIEFNRPLYDMGVCIDYRKLYEWSMSHDVDLEEFLTRKKYMVVIEDKRNRFFAKLIKSGFINKDVIDNYDEIFAIANETKEDENYD